MVIILDFSIGKTLQYFYFRQSLGRQFRTYYTIEKTTADVLIFGSSRAFNHYVPDIFEQGLHQSCYNTGSSGQFILYDYATLKAVLKRYTPKIIILDITQGEFRIERESYERLSFLLPYYKTHTEIQSVIDLKSPFEKYKLISSIYPFNSSFVSLAAGQTDYFKKRNTVIKGYKPLQEIWNGLIETVNTNPYLIDITKTNIYISFLKACQKSGKKILVVCSPTYLNYKIPDISITTASKIASHEHVTFIDFTNDTSFTNHPNLFANPKHLNGSGAEFFTNALLKKIAGYYRNIGTNN